MNMTYDGRPGSCWAAVRGLRSEDIHSRKIEYNTVDPLSGTHHYKLGGGGGLGQNYLFATIFCRGGGGGGGKQTFFFHQAWKTNQLLLLNIYLLLLLSGQQTFFPNSTKENNFSFISADNKLFSKHFWSSLVVEWCLFSFSVTAKTFTLYSANWKPWGIK